MNKQTVAEQSNSDSRRTRRMNRRLQEILKVAARMFAELGYERTTLDMIADELGLSKPGLYYYVKSKEDVLAHIFQSIFRNIIDQVETDLSEDITPIERLRCLIIAYAAQACIYPEGRALFLYQSNLISVCNIEMMSLRERYQQMIEDTIAEGIVQGCFHVADAKIASLALFGSLHCIPLWYVPEGPMSPEEVGNYYATILVGGLVSPLPLTH
jgi:AcrR family transcriptional regulator